MRAATPRDPGAPDTPAPLGRVYLVGAGPGDPELLTLKGRRALEQADVVVYDRLANPRLLEYARPEAQLIYAGKEAGGRAMPQEAINRLLVEHGAAGQVVCRLKGGDPFVYGRGGEEAEALAAAGIPWEYVPGITSAIAVPGYAGIPVTHRGLCSALAVVTAHEEPGEAGSIRWEALARGADTLVFLMGAERLPAVVEQLRAHGRGADTPAAVVSWGTYPRQSTAEGTLSDIVEKCRAAAISAPAIIVVGAVAALRERLRWWDARPLFGKRVALCRPRGQSAELAAHIERGGGEAVVCPTIRIQPLPAPDLTGLDRGYDWVVFTSANGVTSLVAALRARRQDLRRLGAARVAAIGPETARAAERAGLWVDFVPSQFVAEQVAAEFPEPLAGKRVLIPRAREARELLPRLWRQAGAEVDVVPVYETVPDEAGLEALREGLERRELDAVLFTASSTVKNFHEGLPGASLQGVTVACIGPITAATAREVGMRVDVVAAEFTAGGLVRALEQYWMRPEGAAGE